MVNSLRRLNLEQNRIKYIHPETFKSLKELEWISLRSNKLIEIEPKILVEFEKLKYFDVAQNPLSFYIQQELKLLYKKIFFLV